MARKPKEGPAMPDGAASQLGSAIVPEGTVEIIDESAKLVEQSPTLPSAVATAPVHVPQPALYRVTKGGPILHRGVMTAMKEGKIIDPRHYDIEQLKSQNIRLEPV